MCSADWEDIADGQDIVFDVGNVLADFRIKELLAEKGFDAPVIKRIFKASMLSPHWEHLEQDVITEEEALQAFASLDPAIENELRKAYTNIGGILVMCDYTIPWLQWFLSLTVH